MKPVRNIFCVSKRFPVLLQNSLVFSMSGEVRIKCSVFSPIWTPRCMLENKECVYEIRVKDVRTFRRIKVVSVLK